MIDGSLLQIEMLGTKFFILYTVYFYIFEFIFFTFWTFLLKEVDVTGCLGTYQAIKSKRV